MELKLWNKKKDVHWHHCNREFFFSLFHFLLFDSHSCQTSNGIWHLHLIPLRSAKSLSEFLDDSFEFFLFFPSNSQKFIRDMMTILLWDKFSLQQFLSSSRILIRKKISHHDLSLKKKMKLTILYKMVMKSSRKSFSKSDLITTHQNFPFIMSPWLDWELFSILLYILWIIKLSVCLN